MTRRTASEIDKAISARIRKVRNEKGVTQTVLGERIGVTFQQVQKYESGRNRVSAGRIVVIAEALEVPVSKLMGPA
jgi:transcriptional regulator with XRE-family HTH domain